MKRHKQQPKAHLMYLYERRKDTCDHAWYSLLVTEERLLEYCAACSAERWTPLGKQRLKDGA